MYQNPLQTMLNDATNIQSTLYQDTLQFGLALEQRAAALEAKKKAQEIYDGQEASFLFDLAFNAEEYMKAKNAEQREIIKDRALVDARARGELAQAWRVLSSAQGILDNTELAYAQAEARFKAVRVAAELQAAMLFGAYVDAKSR